ncbi:MAG TPA: 3-dehydroquinate synthase [Longimicrobiales bacterium]|nr:3-dehydroquinate synthase [Longimicrobiales bacterium]
MSRPAGGDDARLSLVLPREEARCEINVGWGSAGRIGALVREYAPAHAFAVVADETVATLHGPRVMSALRQAGPRVRLYGFPAGESSKTPATWATLVEALAADGLGRDACVIGLGGGVSCDLAGFVAATFLRGVPLVQLPTTLLAMVDAAIGGKSGVDLGAGKNLAGAFWQPRLVVVDPELLLSLPESELRAGLAEVVKHGAIADAEGFGWLETNGDAVFARDPVALRRVIEDSIRVKASFVAQDVREAGARAMLNFGHTIGHALERVTGYDLAHGPAVAAGMVVEADLGERVGATEAGTSTRIGRLLRTLGLPASPPAGLDARRVLDATRTDKKARAGSVRYSLLHAIGAPARPADGSWTWEVPDDLVLAALAGR